MKWEYDRITNPKLSELNLKGLSGWELVAIDQQQGNSIYVFKRPKP